MVQKKKNEKRQKKEDYWQRLWELTDKYSKAICIDCNNVSSQQINNIRLKLRDLDAIMLMGKNTLMKAALNKKMKEPLETDEDYEERKDTYRACPQLEKLINLLKGNTGLIFCNGDYGEIKKIIDSQSREAPAKVGIIAPDDVWIRAGATGLDPKQTQFFQALNIQTKIVKTQIEIVADKKVVTEGLKIEQSQCALLDKLKIRPFHYKMKVKKVYDNGTIYGSEILDITEDTILESFQKGIANFACLSLGSGYITTPAMPHLMANAFKNLASVTFVTDYSFKQAEALKEASKNVVTQEVVEGGQKKVEKKEEKQKEEEKEEEEEDVDMGGLFGEEEDY